MNLLLYSSAACLLFALLWAMLTAARSFWAERADYMRTPPSSLAAHPERTTIAGLRNVEFSAPRSPRIGAWFAPSRHGGAVILVHGTDADRTSLLFEMECLADAGYGVLALDLPGQGASGGRTRWGVPERHAISTAIDWLCRLPDVDPRRIGGLGVSMGAYVLTQAAILDPRLRSIALIASPYDVVVHNWRATDRWGLLTQIPCYLALRAYGQSLDMKPKDIIASLAPRAVLIVAGGLDTLVPPAAARVLYAAAREPKEWWLVPQARHADLPVVAAAEYRARIENFFARTLGPQPRDPAAPLTPARNSS